jgi:hypothetical protein
MESPTFVNFATVAECRVHTKKRGIDSEKPMGQTPIDFNGDGVEGIIFGRTSAGGTLITTPRAKHPVNNLR